MHIKCKKSSKTPKGGIGMSYKSKKDRQYNSQKQKTKRTNKALLKKLKVEKHEHSQSLHQNTSPTLYSSTIWFWLVKIV